MIDCIVSAERSKSFAIEGNAVFKIVPSRDCMNIANAAIQGKCFCV